MFAAMRLPGGALAGGLGFEEGTGTMDDHEVDRLFDEFPEDVGSYQSFLADRPLLAHYTSIHVLEQIIKNEEIWFSNPLFMNDLEEMRFGLHQGAFLFAQSEDVGRVCGTRERADFLRHCFQTFLNKFDAEHALDVYVFCLSEHDPKNKDGVLSMWRGYGLLQGSEG